MIPGVSVLSSGPYHLAPLLPTSSSFSALSKVQHSRWPKRDDIIKMSRLPRTELAKVTLFLSLLFLFSLSNQKRLWFASSSFFFFFWLSNDLLGRWPHTVVIRPFQTDPSTFPTLLPIDNPYHFQPLILWFLATSSLIVVISPSSSSSRPSHRPTPAEIILDSSASECIGVKASTRCLIIKQYSEVFSPRGTPCQVHVNQADSLPFSPACLPFPFLEDSWTFL